ncbi:Rieske (2Fe-2S) protein [Planctomycetes bacterium K23_9]|uniref:Assimilatory nitrite reductase [NAD(P)H] small subunit n=1 Tax=Stieleria marina TaxID=1930275 RepID=A0A517NY45_9BACT|nr:Assimilatory nitrite reductase [NAD(P)H] small subunit [Planctomycetes bacterium K23_9]
MANQWHEVAASEDLPVESAKEVVIDGRIIAVFRTEKGLFAIDGMCAHQGGPIAEGIVQHDCVTCPWHGWQYELASGIQTINRQPLQETLEVREKDNKIEIRL